MERKWCNVVTVGHTNAYNSSPTCWTRKHQAVLWCVWWNWLKYASGVLPCVSSRGDLNSCLIGGESQVRESRTELACKTGMRNKRMRQWGIYKIRFVSDWRCLSNIIYSTGWAVWVYMSVYLVKYLGLCLCVVRAQK